MEKIKIFSNGLTIYINWHYFHILYIWAQDCMTDYSSPFCTGRKRRYDWRRIQQPIVNFGSRIPNGDIFVTSYIKQIL